MAFTLTGRGTTKAEYTTGGNVGDVFTPAENDVVVVVVNCTTATTFSNVTGWGATWAQVGYVNGTNHHVHIWAARIGASPGSGQVNVTLPSSTSYAADVFQIAGASTSGGVASVFLQSQSANVYNPTPPMAIPALSAFASATNLTLVIGADKNNLTHTADTGFTILQQSSAGNPSFHTCISYQEGEDTSCNINSTGFDYKWISGIAFEVVEETGGDSVPDAFSFTDLTDQTISTQVTSNTITVTGIDVSTAISLSSSAGMEYRINGGSWVTSSGSVVVNDTVQLRVTTSGSYSTAVTGTLDIGGVTDEWSVTTGAEPQPEVTDVDTDEVLVDGQQDVAVTVANFGSDVTQIRLVSGSYSQVLTGLSGTGTSYTIDLPDVSGYSSDTLGVPFTTASHSILLEASNATPESDTLGITLNPKTGWAVVEITNATKQPGSVFENFLSMIPDGSQVLYPTADSTSVTSTGEYSTSSFADIDMLYWDSYLGQWHSFTAESAIEAITGSMTHTLGSVTQDASGVIGHSATVAHTLSAVTQDANGVIGHSGSITNTLSAVTQDASGTVTAPEVTDVDTDEIIVDGQQDVAVTVDNFNSDVTQIRLVSGSYSQVLTGLSGTGDSYTIDLPDVSGYSSDTLGVPFTTASHTILLEASNATPETGTLEVTLNPKTGWAVVEITNATKQPGSVFENFLSIIPDGSQVLYPTADSTSVTSTGEYYTSSSSDIDMLYWDSYLGQWHSFTAESSVAAITGSMTGTLSAITQDATGTLGHSGSISHTLSAVTQDSGGVVGHSATMSHSLGPVTQDASGISGHSGAIDNTLSAVTQSASGTVSSVGSVTGNISHSLSPVNQDASGVTGHSLDISQTLSSVSQDMSVVSGHTGSASQTLGSVTQYATGDAILNITGTVDQTLSGISQSSSGVSGHSGSSDQTLSGVSQSFSGIIGHSGSITNTLAAVTQKMLSTSNSSIIGTAINTLSSVSQDATGSIGHNAVMTGSLGQVSQGASGEIGHVGVGSQTLGQVSQDASGTKISHHQAVVKNTFGRVSQESIAVITQPGNVAGIITQQLGNVTQIADGIYTRKPIEGRAVSTLQSVSQEAVGTVESVENISGSVDSTISALLQTGTGTVVSVNNVTGSIDATLSTVSQNSSGRKGRSGSISSELPTITQQATGVVLPFTQKRVLISSILSPISQVATGEIYSRNMLSELDGDRIKQLYGTSETWEEYDPVLFEGEIGIESDTRRMKIGDGESRWSELTYVNSAPLTTEDITDDGNLFINDEERDFLSALMIDARWEIDIVDTVGGYTGYIQLTPLSNVPWMIKRVSGMYPNITVAYSDPLLHPEYDTLEDAWVNRATLVYLED